jgi:superfamily II DNA/RNA helicase
MGELNKWTDFNIRDDLLRGIYSYGFEIPSEIQKKTILPIINGQDIIAQAQSGSGKTASFLIGSLQSVNLEKGTQILIIAPTHELVKQIANVSTALGSKMKGLCIKTLIGGLPVHDDIISIRDSIPHLIVGTPGRVIDLIKRRIIDTSLIKILILDEADELLSFEFRTNIKEIFQYLNEKIQVAIFSATLPNDIIKLTDKFMVNPVRIILKPDELNVDGIQQYYIAIADDNEKFETVKKLFSTLVISQCIIFVNSINRVIDLYQSMTNEGFSVSCIHSSMTKQERDKAFNDFRNGSNRILISSNITARGIDIQQVGTVVNFDICNDVHTYLHRIGRSGRYGKKGVAINLITKYDVAILKEIEKQYNINISEFKFA